uniref:Uncharacterized protein n=1 Tax=Strix occidentalis caurina TaxID=311401 RepID=A0A8D0ELZ0_STROC
MYWLLSAVGSVMGLGGRGGRLRASSVSHCTSTSLYSSMAARSKSRNCSPGFLVLTWIFFWSRCPAKLLSETLALLGSPALWFRMGIRLVSRVLSFGWKYFRAWKSLCMACPTTILSFKIFRIWKCQKELDRQYKADGDRDEEMTCLGLATFPQRGAVVPPVLTSALRASDPAMGVWLPRRLRGLSSPFRSSSARRSMNRWCLRLLFLLRPCVEPGPSGG